MINYQVFVDIVIKALKRAGQCGENLLKAGLELVVIAVEHREGWVQISPPPGIVQFQAPLAEFSDIVSVQKHALRI